MMNYLFEKYAEDGVLLDVAGFRGTFRELWPMCERRFLKLETRLAYHEPDNPSWQAYAAGKLGKLVCLSTKVTDHGRRSSTCCRY